MGEAYNLEDQLPSVKKMNTEMLNETKAANLGDQLSSVIQNQYRYVTQNKEASNLEGSLPFL